MDKIFILEFHVEKTHVFVVSKTQDHIGIRSHEQVCEDRSQREWFCAKDSAKRKVD